MLNWGVGSPTPCFCVKKTNGSAGGSKSFIYAQNELAEQSEEQLLKSIEQRCCSLG